MKRKVKNEVNKDPKKVAALVGALTSATVTILARLVEHKRRKSKVNREETNNVELDTKEPESVVEEIESETVEPEAVEPEAVKVETEEPETVVAATVEPETVEPETVEPETVEPETVEPETVEPETVEPETVEPETVEPETVEPETVEPETVEPETVEPETVEPETVEPETVEPETVEPETVEPETVEPETVEPKPETSTKKTKKSNPGREAAEAEYNSLLEEYTQNTADAKRKLEEEQAKPKKDSHKTSKEEWELKQKYTELEEKRNRLEKNKTKYINILEYREKLQKRLDGFPKDTVEKEQAKNDEITIIGEQIKKHQELEEDIKNEIKKQLSKGNDEKVLQLNEKLEQEKNSISELQGQLGRLEEDIIILREQRKGFDSHTEQKREYYQNKIKACDEYLDELLNGKEVEAKVESNLENTTRVPEETQRQENYQIVTPNTSTYVNTVNQPQSEDTALTKEEDKKGFWKSIKQFFKKIATRKNKKQEQAEPEKVEEKRYEMPVDERTFLDMVAEKGYTKAYREVLDKTQKELGYDAISEKEEKNIKKNFKQSVVVTEEALKKNPDVYLRRYEKTGNKKLDKKLNTSKDR